MPVYRPDKFRSLFATPLGHSIWDFLNEDSTLARLIAFSEADKPAVQGIEEALLEKFKLDVMDDHVKKMIGHMVRQIMEYQGWVVDQKNVNVFSLPFIKATRYRRSDRCRFFVYRCSENARQLCLVKDRNANFPPLETGGQWKYWTTLSSPLRAAIVFDLMDITAVERAIDEWGYYAFEHRRALRAA